MKFPVFKKWAHSSLVVAFSSMKVGHVVVKGTQAYEGEFRNNWENANSSNWENWEPPKEKIKLYKWAYYEDQRWKESQIYYETEEKAKKFLSPILQRLDYTVIEVDV